MKGFGIKADYTRNKPNEGIGLGPHKGLRSEFLRTYFAIALSGIATLLLILAYLVWDKTDTKKIQYFTGPMARDTAQTLVGIHRSLSSLRGWMLLGDPIFKEERHAAWEDEIYPTIYNLQELSLQWGTAEDVAQFKKLELLLRDLETAQWWIEDVAQTPGNEPASVLYLDQAKPLARQVLTAITAMIDIEKALPETLEMKTLLGEMADFRAFFLRSHSDIGLFVQSGSDDDLHEFNQHYQNAGKIRGQIQQNESNLNGTQRKLFIMASRSFMNYKDVIDQVIPQRRSSHWNFSRDWLQKKVIPLVKTIDLTFREMSEIQFEQIREEAEHADLVRVRLIALTLFDLLILVATAFILSNKQANLIIRPIQRLALAAEKLSEGGVHAVIPPGENDEIGGLIVSFNRMQKNLDEKSKEAQGRLEDLEKKNKTMARTKQAMTGIMSELKEERQKLDQQKHFFESVVESSPNGMVMTDEKDHIILVNKMSETLFGYTRSELMNQPIEVLVPRRFWERHPEYTKGFHADPSTRQIGTNLTTRTIYGRRKDGSEFPVEIGLSPIHQDSDKLFVLAMIVDVTDRRAAEEKLAAERKALEKTNLELDSFVYTASHDLRAPLRGINSFSKFIEEDYADTLDDDGKDYLRRIRSGVNRMTQLIDDLLSLSRISRQKNPYEDVKVADLITSVTERIEYDLEEYQAQLVVQEKMPVIRCDRIKVSEVFLNLINNAVKFSHKNKDALPKIEIGYKPLDGLHQFFVKDNGIGIDPKYHEKVFDIFQRLHSREEYDGTGAGLSIVKRVIEEHNGRLWIDSELGKGATFNFTIPTNLEEG